MQRFSMSWFTQFGAALAPIKQSSFAHNELDKADVTANIVLLYTLNEYLKLLADENITPLALKASRPTVRELNQLIERVLAADDMDSDFRNNRTSIYLTAAKLDTLLDSELAIQPAYFVYPKRAYDIDILATDGTQILSKDVRSLLTEEERYDIEQAGKCLAFEVPTAAGVHLYRVAESFLRRYYTAVVGKTPKRKMRNWGAYITNLRKCGADEKVLSTFDQIRDLHRNPIMHPETRLNIEEALSLLGIVESAISAIVADLQKRDAGTSASPTLIDSTP